MVLGWERSRPADWIATVGSAGGDGWEKMAATEEPDMRRWWGMREGKRRSQIGRAHV